MSDSPDTPSKCVPWDKQSAEYEDIRNEAVTTLLGDQGPPLTPDGPVRYMQSGRWKRVHLDDLLSYSMGEKPPLLPGPKLEAPPGEAKPPVPEAEGVNMDDDTLSSVEEALLATVKVTPPEKPEAQPDTLLSAPNLLEVARRAYRCAGQARQKNGPGPARDMLYRLYTRLGDAAYVCQQFLPRRDAPYGTLALDVQPDLSRATNAAQDAVQFNGEELDSLRVALRRQRDNDKEDGVFNPGRYALSVAVMDVWAVS